MNLAELHNQQPGTTHIVTVRIDKHYAPKPPTGNAQSFRQDLYVSDMSMPNVRFTMWLTDPSFALTQQHIGTTATFMVKVGHPYNGKASFTAKWSQQNQPGTGAAPAYNPPAQQMPPQAAQPFQNAPQSTNYAPPAPTPQPTPQTNWQDADKATQESIVMQSMIKAAVEFLKGKPDATKEEVVQTGSYFARACTNGIPKSTNAVADAFADQYELPDEDIPPFGE